MPRLRLDQLLVQRGLAESSDKALRMILAGSVVVAGQPAAKPGHTYPDDAVIEVLQPPRFVSRGGEKLEGALQHFGLTVRGETCLDAGASTGGFTDCLLQHGAAHVYAVDVGHHQLHPRLLADARVTAMDGVNARHLESTLFPVAPTFATVDASFISLKLLLPALRRVLAAGGRLVTLIKPQFEAAPEHVGTGGVVRDLAIHARVVEEVRRFGVEQAGLAWHGVCTSPLKGPAGNVEFLAYWTCL